MDKGIQMGKGAELEEGKVFGGRGGARWGKVLGKREVRKEGGGGRGGEGAGGGGTLFRSLTSGSFNAHGEKSRVTTDISHF